MEEKTNGAEPEKEGRKSRRVAAGDLLADRKWKSACGPGCGGRALGDEKWKSNGSCLKHPTNEMEEGKREKETRAPKENRDS